MINLCLFGVKDTLSKTLGIALQNRAKGICVLSDAESANVGLIDIDNIDDAEQWRDLKQKNNIPLVALVSNARDVSSYENEFSYILPKPLQFSGLLVAVNNARQQYVGLGDENTAKLGKVEISQVDSSKVKAVQAAANAGAQVTDGSRISVSEVVRENNLVDQQQYLLGQVISAVADLNNDPYCIISWWGGDQWLVLDRHRDKVLLNIVERKLSRVALMRIKSLDIQQRKLSEADVENYRSQCSWECSTEKLIWLLTYYTVRTGGLRSLDLDKPYRLQQWPDLAQYSNSVKDLPLANYWVNNTCSVNDLAKKTMLPVAIVLPFACCCSTTGFLSDGMASTDAVVEEKPQKTGLRGILSMIFNKLAA